MIKFLAKLLAFYVIVFGIVGLLIQVNDSLFDLRESGDFFLRSTPLTFVAAFFVAPLFGLMSFVTSITSMQMLAPEVLEVHLIIIVFFGFAVFGLLKHSRFILFVAALVPISQVILRLDLLRYI